MIRQAETGDASRIAEISVFTKRMNYRTIFNDDAVSFGGMQVLPLAEELIRRPEKLAGVWVYDDGIVKGYVRVDGTEIAELYVDTFFENAGIGTELLRFAVREKGCRSLWVLEKNGAAIRFYERNGFAENGRRCREEGTDVYAVEMVRKE